MGFAGAVHKADLRLPAGDARHARLQLAWSRNPQTGRLEGRWHGARSSGLARRAANGRSRVYP